MTLCGAPGILGTCNTHMTQSLHHSSIRRMYDSPGGKACHELADSVNHRFCELCKCVPWVLDVILDFHGGCVCGGVD